MAALAYLDVDEVWWLVSPQNPLKPADGMASARAMAHHPRSHLTRFPSYRFVWLMAADNLAHDGHHWLMAVLARRHKAACDLGT